uniref:CCHC-type domain-containing protein n=1 Tax=Crocodylus porosus TaxID=8502 RepID=A0A7M4F3Z9_CROPO
MRLEAEEREQESKRKYELELKRMELEVKKMELAEKTAQHEAEAQEARLKREHELEVLHLQPKPDSPAFSRYRVGDDPDVFLSIFERQLLHLTVLDQFYYRCPRESKTLVKDRGPKTGPEAAEIADQLLLNREGSDKKPPYSGKEHKGVQRGGRGGPGPKGEKGPSQTEQKEAPDLTKPTNSEKRGCYNCGEPGHIKPHCTKLTQCMRFLSENCSSTELNLDLFPTRSTLGFLAFSILDYLCGIAARWSDPLV